MVENSTIMRIKNQKCHKILPFWLVQCHNAPPMWCISTGIVRNGSSTLCYILPENTNLKSSKRLRRGSEDDSLIYSRPTSSDLENKMDCYSYSSRILFGVFAMQFLKSGSSMANFVSGQDVIPYTTTQCYL